MASILAGGGVILQTMEAWPKPVSVVSVGVVPLCVMKFLHVHSYFGWFVWHFIFTTLLFFIIFWNISKLPKRWRNLSAVGIIFSPIAYELMNLISDPGLFLIIGWLLFLFSNQKIVYIIGILILSLTNAPETVIASVILSIYYLANPNQNLFKKIKTLIGISVPIFITLEIWLSVNHVTGFLTGKPGGYIVWSASQFLSNMPNSLYSCYGVFWLPIVLYIYQSRAKRRFYLLFALVFAPLFWAITVNDATKVFVAVAFPVAVMAIIDFFKNMNDEKMNSQYLVWLLLPVCSPVNYWYANEFIQPFADYKSLFHLFFMKTGNCSIYVGSHVRETFCNGIDALKNFF